MLNKLLQKSRNTKFDSSSIPGSKPLSQSGLVPSTKQSVDLQKDSYTFTANSATLIPSSSSHSSTISQKQSPNSQVIQTMPSSIVRQTSPISSSLCSSNVSMQITNSQQPSSRTQGGGSVNMSNSQFTTSAYNTNSIMTLYGKQKAQQQGSIPVKQQLDVAQEDIQINTPQTIKYKTFDTQNLSIQRVAVNLSNIEEFKVSESKRETSSNSQSQPSSLEPKKKEQELEGTVKLLQNKIEQLVKELEKQTILSNQVLEDNSLFRKKYQELKDNSSQKQNSLFGRSDSISSSQVAQSDIISSIQIFETLEENKKLKLKLQQSQLEAAQWREKYEKLEKLQEQNEENLKEKLKDQYQKEIQALNNELYKFKQQQFGITKSKKVNSLLRSSNTNTNTMLKENTNNNNIAASTYTDDWHSNYMLLKDDREKTEKMLKKKIESLEEQNAFLQNEVNQLHQKHIQQIEDDEPNFVEKQQNNYIQDAQMQNRKSNNLQELNYYFSQNLN